MTTLNKNTKKAQYYIDCFNRSIGNNSIYDIYTRPSQAKINIGKELESKAKDLHCNVIRYLHGNSFNFVMGYSDGKTLYIETVSNSYSIEL